MALVPGKAPDPEDHPRAIQRRLGVLYRHVGHVFLQTPPSMAGKG